MGQKMERVGSQSRMGKVRLSKTGLRVRLNPFIHSILHSICSSDFAGLKIRPLQEVRKDPNLLEVAERWCKFKNKKSSGAAESVQEQPGSLTHPKTREQS